MYPSGIAHRRRPMASMPCLLFPLSLITLTTAYSFQPAGTFFAIPRRGVANRLFPGSRRVQGAHRGSPRSPRRSQSRQSRTAKRAITVLPGTAQSARLEDVPEPAEAAGPGLVRSFALGVCAADGEIFNGKYGFAP